MRELVKRIALIPAYQPDTKMLDLIEQAREAGFFVVVVNDGSGNAYESVFQTASIDAKVLEHEENRGKGAALKTGLAYIKKQFEEPYIIVTADADGQHKISDMIKVCDESCKYPKSLILGSRPLDKNVPLRSRFGNTVTRYVYRIATGLAVYDTQTGLRAFTDLLIDRMLEIEGCRYEYEMNVLLRFAKIKGCIREVWIETVYLEGNASSHFDTVKDSYRIYKEILKFSACSLASFLLDYCLFCILSACTGRLVLANVIARVCSSAFNFTLNKKLVFHAKGSTWKYAVKYFALAAWILFCNTWILKGLTVIRFHAYSSKVLAEMAMFVFSWLIQRSIIFRKEAATA